ncbi:hypothetical protein FRACYDRAFT_178867 [Fragilariopsis cylindrus CCMP1102]|uniref:S-adenosyl-L-methionine-dependent methyltransferase n=1 Tax=Fragilariopsis cylindrus CCMP1102 TaxID=635003 RepID=A0A1E7FZX8_9STRA|nr:hypothetical protein FRACYDRAFT_178867 [Fragilariopsis cylindrus CCMP1102]|eukprot:OEU23708.1 hypothetical protein FRACYDRAFT_178867 [Fragilariopsis cylindrus CCMP1102]
MSEVNNNNKNNYANTDASSKKSKQNKKRKNKSPQLQPGDPNYKTPTQLRNARKRRKTKTTKATTTSSSTNFNNVISNNNNDPSLKYLSNPKIAPTVRNAIRFFRDKSCAPMGENHDTYFPVTVGPKIGWRHIARLAIQRRKKKTIQQGGGSDSSTNTKKKPKSKTRIGLFVPGSHELLPVPDCPVHHRRINELIKVLEEECNDLNVPIFDNDDDTTDDFGLRYVAVAVERSTQKQQLVLVWKEPDEIEDKNKNKPLNTLIKRLVKLSNATAKATDRNSSPSTENHNQKLIRLHSIWVHYNNSWKHSNSIFDRTGRWETKFVHDDDDNDIDADPLRVPLYFPPQVFRQANLDGFSKIIVNIREWLNEQLLLPSSRKPTTTTTTLGHCLELYGGVGTIGLNLIDLFDSIESSDENPFNEKCFHAAANEITTIDDGSGRQQPIIKSKRDSITYITKSASDVVVDNYSSLQKARVVIVDPPRKGLDPPVIDALCRDYETSDNNEHHQQQALIYVSCGFDAFRRDYEALVEKSGKWTLDRAEGHILFPGSDAIETVAYFTRTK